LFACLEVYINGWWNCAFVFFLIEMDGVFCFLHNGIVC
jgi:hypothetical protein